MPQKPMKFKQQIQHNLVAIISLFAAISGLFYDHWRDQIQVKDLSQLLDNNSAAKSQLLYDTWQQEWEDLHTSKESEAKVSQKISHARSAVLQAIHQIE